MNHKQPASKGIKVNSDIMTIAKKLYESEKHWDDETFISALELLLMPDKIDTSGVELKWLEEHSAWCAHHGHIALSTRYLMILKRILDHEQSIPGPHAIRIHSEEVL